MSPRGQRGWWAAGLWTALVLYSALIAHLSSRPVPVSLDGKLPGWDKLAHMAAYGVWAALFLAALSTTVPRLEARRRAYLTFLAAAIYGLSDEIHQAFVPERHFDLLDLAANCAGALVVVALWMGIRRWRAHQTGAGK
jgi:VanZ family protein